MINSKPNNKRKKKPDDMSKMKVTISECHQIVCSECGSGHMPMTSVNIEFPNNANSGKCSDVSIVADRSVMVDGLPVHTAISMNYTCAACDTVEQKNLSFLKPNRNFGFGVKSKI